MLIISEMADAAVGVDGLHHLAIAIAQVELGMAERIDLGNQGMALVVVEMLCGAVGLLDADRQCALR